MRKASLFLLCTLFSAVTFAQDGGNPWLVDTMYKSGKINAVVAVVAVVLAGLAAWLFSMERRIRRMEDERRR